MSTTKTNEQQFTTQLRSYPTNVREIQRADGTIIKEYIFENPRSTKNSQTPIDLTSSGTTSDDDQPSSREKFAKIKAKFERRSSINQTSSPTSSSSNSSVKRIGANRNASKSTIELRSNFTNQCPINSKTSFAPPSPLTSQRTRSVSNTQSSKLTIGRNQLNVSSNLIHSNDQLKQENDQNFSQISSSKTSTNNSQTQYEITDEYGNIISVEGIEEILKMSGIGARDVPQSDGTILKEYIVDDPKIISQVQAKKLQTTFQPTFGKEHGPPPPPRVLRQPVTSTILPTLNIENTDHLVPDQPYQYTTRSGRRIQFFINDGYTSKNQSAFSQINGISNGLDNHLSLSSSSSNLNVPNSTLSTTWDQLQDQFQSHQTTINNEFVMNEQNKQAEPIKETLNNLDQNSDPNDHFGAIVTEPIIDWSILKQQDPDGQIDPELVRQFIQQRFQHDNIKQKNQTQTQQELKNIQEIPIRHDSLSQYGFTAQNPADSHIFQFDQSQFTMTSVNATGRF